MDGLKQLLATDWKNGLLFIAALIIVFVWLIQKWDFICERFGIQTKKVAKEEKQDKDIEELKAHAKKTDGNIDKIIGSIDELKGFIKELSDQVLHLQAKNDLNEAARLKDRIAQGYRYWHERGEWTSRDKEAMEDLINAYSQYSENSFVHSVVEKEMHTWKIVDD